LQNFAGLKMFDIGFSEIIFILVITLLVVGPERLPRVARTAGLWLGKIRGFVTSVKADIDQELAAEELKRTLAKQAAMPELEEIIEKTTGNILTGETSADPAPADVGKPAQNNPSEPVPSEVPDDKQA
jgi:sec-independent protein translocase protein TatB